MRHWYGVITDENNRYVANAAVKVYTAGAVETGTLAAGDLAVTGSFEEIYSDDGLTPIDQQGGDFLWTDSVGWAEFWADSATVVMALVFDGDVKRVITDVELDGSGGGGGTVIGGPITSGDLTMSSGVILGRTSVGTGAIQEITPTTGLTLSGGTLSVDGTQVKSIEHIIIACSDESTAITTGAAKRTFRMPYAFTLTEIPRASVNTAPTGSPIVIDINEAGSSILSTKLSIDASEETSTSAATAAVLSDSSLADDAEITIDFDQVGSTIAGAGVKVVLIGRRT